jgi:small subunit ribosomal protein S9
MTEQPSGTSTVTPAPSPATSAKKSGGANPYVWGTGRRKTAVARVRIRPGAGKFLINTREVEKFFTLEKDRTAVLTPLRVTNSAKNLDVFVNVSGGGVTGQAGAIVLGLARALVKSNSDHEAVLRDHHLLTRDARKVERKKYGRPGARKRFQFSKR